MCRDDVWVSGLKWRRGADEDRPLVRREKREREKKSSLAHHQNPVKPGFDESALRAPDRRRKNAGVGAAGNVREEPTRDVLDAGRAAASPGVAL